MTIPDQHEWSAADVSGPDFDTLFSRIFVLMAWANGQPTSIIGQGFIMAADKNHATCLTAAHNIDEIRRLQNQRNVQSLSLPDILRPPPGAIKLAPDSVRACFFSKEHGVLVCNVDWAIEDRDSDIALCQVSTPDLEETVFFDMNFDLSLDVLQIGDHAVVAGHVLDITHLDKTDSTESFILKTNKVMRKGRVFDTFDNGYLITKGRGFRASFPAEGGLSGAPVFRAGDAGQSALVVGLVSQHTVNANTSEFRVKGDTIVSGLSSFKFIEKVGNTTTIVLDSATSSRSETAAPVGSTQFATARQTNT